MQSATARKGFRSAMSQEVRSRPLSRSVTAVLVVAVLTAFLPHRERALLLTDAGLESVLASQTLAGNSFAAPWLYGSFDRDRWGWWSGDSERPDLRRERFAPGRTPLAQALPDLAAAAPARGSESGIIPLGGSVPSAAPAFSSPLPNPGGASGGPASGGPGPIGSLPGGGGGGGGGSISTPVVAIVPPPPPVAAVPEPATWAFMILGFGLIGFVLRRSRSGKIAVVSA